MFPSVGLGTALQPMSAQEGRTDDAKATGCFGKKRTDSFAWTIHPCSQLRVLNSD